MATSLSGWGSTGTPAQRSEWRKNWGTKVSVPTIPVNYSGSGFGNFKTIERDQPGPDISYNFVKNHPAAAKIVIKAKEIAANPYLQAASKWSNRASEVANDIITAGAYSKNYPIQSTGSKIGDISADLFGSVTGFVANPGGAAVRGANVGKTLWEESEKLVSKGMNLSSRLRKLPNIAKGTAKLAATTGLYGASESVLNNQPIKPKQLAESAGANVAIDLLTRGLAKGVKLSLPKLNTLETVKPVSSEQVKTITESLRKSNTESENNGNIELPSDIPNPGNIEETVNVPKDTETTFQSTVIPGGKEFMEQDVVPKTKSVISGAADTWRRTVNLLSPSTGVPPEALDQIYEMKGDREKQAARLNFMLDDWEKTFDRMPEADRIDFIDRQKTGTTQKTPELQKLSNWLQTGEDLGYQRLSEVDPSQAYKENHFRVFWKSIPGTEGKSGLYGIFGKRPILGDQGFKKHGTLPDMSTGISEGGIPYSTNPITLFKMSRASEMKYITARRMWEAIKPNFAKFVRPGDEIPDGYVRFDDPIAKKWFMATVQGSDVGPDVVDENLELRGLNIDNIADKRVQLALKDIRDALGNANAKAGQPIGLVKSGEWYVEQNVARILNNFVSRDKIREIPAGRGLMAVKNFTTGLELSLSPFHFVFETFESVSSQFGIGFEYFTRGQFLKGAREIGKSFLAPAEYARTGGSIIRMFDNPDEFIRTMRGESFIKQYPEAKELIDAAFKGGAKLEMHEDYRLQSSHTFQQNIASGNYIGAGIRMIPAINEVLMRPLFEEYIPRLKLGLFFKLMSKDMEISAKELATGKISMGELSRKNWDRVENRFGETNYDNLFWNRTFKTAMQIMLRSVTWKLGNIRGFGGAFVGQAKELAEPFNLIKDEEGNIKYAGRAPNLDPDMGWVFGQIVTTVIISSLTMKGLTGQWPNELKDYFFPQTGDKDKNGNDIRLSVPTYIKDAMHLVRNPAGYVVNSLSGVMGRIIDAARNEDYFGNYVYDPNDPAYIKVLDFIKSAIPIPFSFQQVKRLNESRSNLGTKILGFGGFITAPKEYTQSDFQQQLQRAYTSERPSMRMTPTQYKKYTEKKKLKDKIFYGEARPQDIADALRAGVIKKKGVNTFVKDARLTPMQVMWKYLSYEQRKKLYYQASPEEKKQLDAVDAMRKSK